MEAWMHFDWMLPNVFQQRCAYPGVHTIFMQILSLTYYTHNWL